MRLRRRLSPETFKRGQLDKATVLETKVSSSHVSVPRRDPNVPRTTKESDALVVNHFIPTQHIITLRTKDNTWRGLKCNPAMPSMKDMDNTTRTQRIKIIVGTGSTPSFFVELMTGIPARVIGAVRRFHNPNWKKQTNQYIRRAHSFNRIEFQR